MASPTVNTETRGINVSRHFTTKDVDPYTEVVWEISDIRMLNWRDGSVNFEQLNVEFPSRWSESARQIVASKYFRGQLGTSGREHSARQLIDRVVNKYTDEGWAHGYFLAEEDREAFRDELKFMLVHQMFSFNSPVWFNVGTADPQQVSACFILSVDDTMEDILDWYREEGMIFKRGSGAGTNLSKLRSSRALLSAGGRASGPVSFMRGADASAGTISSGGATRRAAKLVCLDVDHPDIVAFVECKAREERKIRALRDAGFDMDLSGEDSHSVQYQNANNSVRVSDAFMRAVEQNLGFDLVERHSGEVVETVRARELFLKIASAAWDCADPGLQFNDTINSWHTNPVTGPITASNPCSEYMSLDNSSCNLASLNLMKFRSVQGGFEWDSFAHAVRTIITAMDISVAFGDFPTEKITETTRAFRQLGIGYANLGSLLMSMGKAYDSVEGRELAGAITSLMSAVSYRQSADLADAMGAYEGFAVNAVAHRSVIGRHLDENVHAVSKASSPLAVDILQQAQVEWELAMEGGDVHGFRNAQVSLLAPTGTIAFMMDCATTGVEPEFALVKLKKMHGGGSLTIVNQTVHMALSQLGYDRPVADEIVAFIEENGHAVGAPGLAEDHYPVFDTAMGDLRSIAPMGHVQMLAAVQPFLSGSISKTINMPETATVADISDVYTTGWKLGLKSLAVYRDGCKAAQPLAGKKAAQAPAAVEAQAPGHVVPVRRRMPARRPGTTTSFTVGGAQGYLTANSYPDNGPGEIFLKLGKQGSTLAGVMDALAISISIGLQYGIPLQAYVEKFVGMQFEPRGMTSDPDIRIAQSILDYVFRRIALDHLPLDTRMMLNIMSSGEREAALDPANVADAPPALPSEARSAADQALGSADIKLCVACGIPMTRSGSCFACASCGTTSGCS